MVTQPPKDTPFGLEPNLAAGLAYLLSILGGIIMLAGGGTNRFVKWAACQSIMLFLVWFVVRFALALIAGFLHFLILLLLPLYMLIGLVFFIAWLVCVITAFQGKEVRLPVVADLTQSVFGAMLG
jgi:uncharacterized membrane protein